ncbi:hypothetical protein [Streptomyces spectabilis]|uniref:hypothetical protein n=1 Tax=Streptomyces spectabilis TaxID=68270 RepID=UPI0016140A49|nr:hypothetical protein GCM10010245_51960 [Streptomyces spectabilis]
MTVRAPLRSGATPTSTSPPNSCSAPQGQLPPPLDRAEAEPQEPSSSFLCSDTAAQHLSRLADEPVEADGALHDCLLNLVQERDPALWWQFAAGAGNATAAHCLYLLHLHHGELRDDWAHQAFILGAQIQLTPRPCCHQLDTHTKALREAVDRLKADQVDGAHLHHPDQHLAGRIEELADAC